MRLLQTLLMTSFTIGLSSVAFAQNASLYGGEVKGDSLYCDNLGLGEYFYCVEPEPEDEEVQEKPEAPVAPVAPAEPVDPDIEQLNDYKAEFERITQVAVWNPSEENVYEYLTYQSDLLDRVQDFSAQFTKTVWQNPELNFSVEHPVNNKGIQHYRAETASAHRRNLAKIKDRYGFYYFYAGSCGACDIFTPVLKNFATYHNLSILPVSMDGAENVYFDNWVPNNGTAERLGLEKTLTPAVVMLDTKTGETIPVSFGVVTVLDLERRIFVLTDGERAQYTREF